MAREETVRLLLITINDYLPTVRGSSSLLAAVPGAGESLYSPCEDCGGTGRVAGYPPRCCEVCKAGKHDHPTGLSCRKCPVCYGEGQRKRRSKEPYDAYTGKKVAELDAETVNARINPKRFVIQTQPDFAEEEGWLRERERYWKHGSYAELYNVLDWLRDRHILRYETLMHWIYSQSDDFWHWSDRALDGIDDTIRLVTARMPYGIKAPGWVVRRYKEEKVTATSDALDKILVTGPVKDSGAGHQEGTPRPKTEG